MIMTAAAIMNRIERFMTTTPNDLHAYSPNKKAREAGAFSCRPGAAGWLKTHG